MKHGYKSASLNFARYLTAGEMPMNRGCASARKKNLKVNYMYGDISNCAYGKFSKVPYIHYHEETDRLPYDYVFLKLNSYSGHEFYLDLVGMNVLKGQKSRFFTRYYRTVTSSNHFKQIDFLYLFVPRSEYIVEHMNWASWLSWNLAQMVLFVLPAFCIIFFNNDYIENGIYWMQFGIMFDLFSNLTWSLVDLFRMNENLYVTYFTLCITFFMAYSESFKKKANLIKIW